MADFPREPNNLDRSAGEVADLESVRDAARSGYQGRAGVVEISGAMKKRDDLRAERERRAAKVHYLGTPRKPR